MTMQRPVGVSVPQGQNQLADEQKTRGAPRTLMAIHELRTFGIQYTDDTGAVHVGLCHKMGDAIYIHPHDEAWAGSIRSAAAWLAKEVNERISLHEATQAVADVPDKPPIDLAPPPLADAAPVAAPPIDLAMPSGGR